MALNSHTTWGPLTDALSCDRALMRRSPRPLPALPLPPCPSCCTGTPLPAPARPPSEPPPSARAHACARRAQRFVGGAPRLSARLGESASAYQSPGKDLDAINRSLSGRPLPRGALLGAGGLVLQPLEPNSVRRLARQERARVGFFACKRAAPRVAWCCSRWPSTPCAC